MNSVCVLSLLLLYLSFSLVCDWVMLVGDCVVKIGVGLLVSMVLLGCVVVVGIFEVVVMWVRLLGLIIVFVIVVLVLVVGVRKY